MATAFPHAVELLSSGAGIVVPHRDPTALAEALRRVLTEPGLAASMEREAARLAPAFGWPAVARQYADLAERTPHQLRSRACLTPQPSFEHLARMTDEHGPFEHAAIGPTAVLDHATADRLVLLRSLFETARSRAQNSTAVGRHAALVLLDGACELALTHAADNLGISRQRKGLETIYEEVQQHILPSGAIEGWPGVRQMHRARNAAQHEGILPDATQLDRWVGDSERFLSNLVGTVFRARLSEVHRADVLSSPLLRAQFAQAEAFLEAGDAPSAVSKGLEAFDAARSQWREQSGPNGLGIPGWSLPNPFSGMQALEQPVRQLDDFIEVQPFAPDMGEYLWLTNLRDRTGPAPTVAEAQRALVFAFEWTLRWEAFSARYDAGAVQQWRRELRPPPTTHPELGPRLAGTASVGVAGSALPGARPLVDVVLQLVDAPGNDFEPWLADLQSALRDGWKAMFSAGTYVYPTVDRVGRVVLPALRPDVDAKTIATIVRQAIAAANQMAAAGKNKDVLDSHREAVMAVADDDNRAMFVAVREAFVDGTETSPIMLRPVIEVEPRPDLGELVREQSFIHSVQSATSTWAQVEGNPPMVRVDRAVQPEQLAGALKAALAASREKVALRAEDHALRDAIQAEVTERFRDALGQ